MSRIVRPSSSSGIADAWCWLMQRHYRIAQDVQIGHLQRVTLEVVDGQLHYCCRVCGAAIE